MPLPASLSASNVSSGRRFPTEATVARRCRAAVTVAALPLFLGGCDLIVMFPSGDVAAQQRNLVVASTGLMLLIVLPVMALTAYFAWHYRASNREAVYDPGWHHSTQLEVVIWTGPLIIVVALGAITWISTHTLDPFRPLARIERGKPVPQGEKPLTIQVVALDWKWLFLYPEQGIATVNELAAPLNRQIEFKITASSVMNTFYVPALAGMIYAMPAMETKLYAVINKPGVFDGFSANYSGSGFSRMNFKFHGLAPGDFDGWVSKVKDGAGKPVTPKGNAPGSVASGNAAPSSAAPNNAAPGDVAGGSAEKGSAAKDRGAKDGAELTQEAYLQLERPSEAEPVRYYSTVAAGLYDSVVNMCAVPGKMCISEMMGIDSKGGAGTESRENRERLEYDNRHLLRGDEPPAATAPASGRPARGEVQPQGMQSRPGNPETRDGGAAPTTQDRNTTPDAAPPHKH